MVDWWGGRGVTGHSGLIIINHLAVHMFMAATQTVVSLSDFHLIHCTVRTVCVCVFVRRVHG